MTVTDGSNPELQVGINIGVEPHNFLAEHKIDLTADTATARIEQTVLIPDAGFMATPVREAKFLGSVQAVQQRVDETRSLAPVEQIRRVIESSTHETSAELGKLTTEHGRLLGRLMLKQRLLGGYFGAIAFAWGAEAAKQAADHKNPTFAVIVSAAGFLTVLSGKSERGERKSRATIDDMKSTAEKHGVTMLIRNSLSKPEES